MVFDLSIKEKYLKSGFSNKPSLQNDDNIGKYSFKFDNEGIKFTKSSIELLLLLKIVFFNFDSKFNIKYLTYPPKISSPPCPPSITLTSEDTNLDKIY